MHPHLTAWGSSRQPCTQGAQRRAHLWVGQHRVTWAPRQSCGRVGDAFLCLSRTPRTAAVQVLLQPRPSRGASPGPGSWAAAAGQVGQRQQGQRCHLSQSPSLGCTEGTTVQLPDPGLFLSLLGDSFLCKESSDRGYTGWSPPAAQSSCELAAFPLSSQLSFWS